MMIKHCFLSFLITVLWLHGGESIPLQQSLSPLKVEFQSLNLQIILHWYPGSAFNPSNTVYFVQYKIYGDSQWKNKEECWGIRELSCDLTNEMSDLKESYYARVKAVSDGIHMDWSMTKRYNPWWESIVPLQESLSPLKVEFQSLNLKSILHWYPGSSFNSSNTIYFVQYKIYGDSQWKNKEECWGIRELSCDLTNEMSDLKESYYARVKAVSDGIHMNWSMTKRYNPWWERSISLSPLKVEFQSLNLHSILHWYPGSAFNPSNTVYFVQYKIYGDSQWKNKEECWGIRELSCDLTNEMSDVKESYYARVKAVSDGIHMNWSMTKRYNPWWERSISLSPLKVEFQSLNLHSILHWYPGSAFNPSNTVYFVQYKIYGDSQWKNKEECWGIRELSCDLTNEMSDVKESYYARVKAVYDGIHMNWSMTKRYNPWWERSVSVQESLSPLKVEFQSLNLQIILHWYPESAFNSSNTVYFVQYKIYGDSQWKNKEECWGIRELSCDLTNEMSDLKESYYARVKAVSDGIHMNWSMTKRYNPWWENTEYDPL